MTEKNICYWLTKLNSHDNISKVQAVLGRHADVAQVVAHLIGSEEVSGPSHDISLKIP